MRERLGLLNLENKFNRFIIIEIMIRMGQTIGLLLNCQRQSLIVLLSMSFLALNIILS